MSKALTTNIASIVIAVALVLGLDHSHRAVRAERVEDHVRRERQGLPDFRGAALPSRERHPHGKLASSRPPVWNPPKQTEKMAVSDPFAFLAVDKELVCTFFAVFSRFEFALKDCGYVREENGTAAPAWRRFAK